MAAAIYTLCTLTAFLCAILLLRSYGRTKFRLLLWSALCFVGLGFSNLFLIFDRILFPGIDFSLIRLIPALIGTVLLLYGLIWEAD